MHCEYESLPQHTFEKQTQHFISLKLKEKYNYNCIYRWISRNQVSDTHSLITWLPVTWVHVSAPVVSEKVATHNEPQAVQIQQEFSYMTGESCMRLDFMQLSPDTAERQAQIHFTTHCEGIIN